MTVILLLLAAVGLCHILVDGKILEGFKRDKLDVWKTTAKYRLVRLASGKLREMLKCYQCAGFHAGWIAYVGYSLAAFEGVTLGGACAGVLKGLGYAFAVSYLSMLGAVLLLYLNVGPAPTDEGN